MNIHDSMLFRWVGYDIEKPECKDFPAPRRKPLTVKPKLTDHQIEQYLNYLRSAFDPERGLRVSDYKDADKFGKHDPVAQPRPCLYFTEQAAGDAEEHWRLYGRLGFGFPKGFIFHSGGRPVIYSGGAKDPLSKAISTIRKALAGQDKDGHKARRGFEMLARFIKSTSLPPMERPESGTGISKGKTGAKQAAKGTQARSKSEQYEFPEYSPIRFLREREWRLLEPESSKQPWHRDAEGHLWFAPEAGKELQLVIVPCNLVLQQVCNDPLIRKRLTGKSGFKAQLISAQVLRKS